MEKYQNKVGNIVSVSGNNIIVRLSDKLKSGTLVIDGMVYRIGQIGSFMKVPLGNTILFGIVNKAGAGGTNEGEFDNIKGSADQQWLSVSLIGEQIGTRFERGISQSPTVGDAVHIVTISDLMYIYGGYNEETSIDVGNISVSTSLNAYLDLDKLISRHFAILGSTGAGKSNAVGVTLNAIISKKLPRTRILMLDPHGEYSSVFGEDAQVFKVNAQNPDERLYVPYWALSFNEFINMFDENMNEQSEETLREKVLEVKKLAASRNGIVIDPQMITVDSPIPFNLKQLWYDSAASSSGSGGTVGAKANIHDFLSNIDSKIRDPRYDFLLKPGEYNPDLWGRVNKNLTELLMSWIGSDKPITILDISDVPSDIMMPISGTLLNVIYEALYWGQETEVGGREQPLLVVLEEAHNYLKAGANSVASRTVQRIAKEGRKYGVSLLLVTQRPTELDETVLSQCGTIIALRMNNTKDINFVSAAIQGELRAIVEMLPSLRVGECVISGESVSIPSRVQFYKLPRAPKSVDPNVSEKWKKPYIKGDNEYKKLVTSWMNKKFDLESIYKNMAPPPPQNPMMPGEPLPQQVQYQRPPDITQDIPMPGKVQQHVSKAMEYELMKDGY